MNAENEVMKERVVEETIPVVETVKPVVTSGVSSTTSNKLLRLAVIGTGNCGSMLANQASKELGLDAVAINGATKDLELLDAPNIIRLQVGDGKGTGKDRDKAKEFFLSDSGLVLDKNFTKVIENNDVIYVATSTAGGFGSGASIDLTDVLSVDMYPEKIFIMVGVLPFNGEGRDALEGTRSWLKEMLALNVGYMIYDNNRTSELSDNKAAARINDAFIEDLKVMQGDFLGRTLTGGIDERDMLTVLSAPGRIVVDSMSGIEVSDIVDNSLIRTVENHITNSSKHAELVPDKEILASAIMYTLGDEFDRFKRSIKADMQEVFGTHVKDTSNFSDSDGGEIAVVLSGLTEPAMVIDRLLNKLQKMTTDINSRKASTSKLDKFDAVVDPKLHISAKQSFADETVVVKAQQQTDGKDVSKEELLKRFLDRKKSK